ncbi:MAG: DUF1559 domain-containing protein [Planctomycetes bacterium]|nr:DUF1559 domain-containing protein [Planctomycetota bacterium]
MHTPRSLSRTRRAGFTLVELLVVIAIIGILIALLLPAIQAAREAARRSSCENNLKQIGLALANYHGSHKWFPAGAYWSNTGTQNPNGTWSNNRGSVLIRLLPYIEQQQLYNEFNLNISTDDQRLGDDSVTANPLLRGVQVDTYICPTDINRPATGPSVARPTNYHANMGPSTAISNNPNCSCPLYSTFRTYNRVGAATPASNPAGPFSRDGRNYLSRIQDCLDGLSNTIYFGEVRAGCSGHINGGWSNSNRWGIFTQVPINFDSCRTMAEAQALGMNLCFANCNWNAEVGFKSLHPGGAQFLFGDGSVHFLSQTIDMKVYNYLGDKNDKTAVAIPQG